MKIKIWTGAVTLVLAAIILKYYAVNPGETQTLWRPEPSIDQTESGGRWRERSAGQNLVGDQSPALTEEQTTAATRPPGVLAGQTGAESRLSGQDGNNPMIRVLIKNDDLQGIFHEAPQITGTGNFTVRGEDRQESFGAGEVAQLGEYDELEIIPEEGSRLQILNLKRAQEHPLYGGILKLSRQTEGVVILNELPLEEYLPAVLSSEMSAAFPREALKAQAVCARTYAIKKIQENEGEYYGADLDDSVSYQVYNNREECEETRRAVQDTAGLVLAEGENLADVYYYSTSCGVTTEDVFASEREFREFIETVRETDMERQEAWYRWRAVITPEQIRQNLSGMQMDPPETVTGLRVTARRENGQAVQLAILGPEEEVQIQGEYNIRKALAPGKGMLTLQDGSGCDTLGMLPSAWFVADGLDEEERVAGQSEPSETETGMEPGAKPETETGTEPEAKPKTGMEPKAEGKNGEGEKSVETAAGERFLLTGGGYGHGNGLSQNGARLMAARGDGFEEILEFYYPDKQIVPIGRETEKEQET